MKDSKKTEIKVGVTVVLGIIIFLWILGWAKNFQLYSTDVSLNVNFSNVAGLEIGDQVTVNGVRKGYVQDMKISDNSVLVKLSLNEDVLLSEDAVFSLNMLDLMGGKKIEIFQGISDKKLDITKTHNGKFVSGIPEVMAVLGSVQDDLLIMIQDIKITLSSINEYLVDDNLQSNVKNSMSNLSTLSKKLNLMVDENREGVKQITQNTIELTNDAKVLLSQNKEDITLTLKKSKEVLAKTNDLLETLNTLTSETKDQKNNLGKLLYDENIYQDLKTVLEQVNKLTTILVDQIQNDGIKVDANIF